MSFYVVAATLLITYYCKAESHTKVISGKLLSLGSDAAEYFCQIKVFCSLVQRNTNLSIVGVLKWK